MNLGLPEIIVILIVVLIVFGPSKVPEFSRAIGRAMREFRKAMADLEDTLEAETSARDSPSAEPLTSAPEGDQPPSDHREDTES